MSRQPVVLIIRDGWGENHNSAHDSFNAVKQAKTPVAHKLSANWPRTEIMACGRDVGLPRGVMGNSEVGHQNIGAGRIVDQEITRIDKAFEEGTVADNAVLNAAVAHTANSGGALHLMGLVSDAGVHAMLEHLYGLVEFAKSKGVEKLFIHCFTDGRDTPPFSGKGYVEQLEKKLLQIGLGRIASVSGRFWAMDRDLRWDRVEKAYNCLTGNKVERTAASAIDAIQGYYDKPLDDNRKGDEFVVPTAIVDHQGNPVGPISSGDAVVFFNFRGDRPRELTRAFIESGFDGFDRGKQLDLYYATMTEYQKGLCDHVVFRKPAKMPSILGSYVAELGIPQFRCAETEKFPHVTFFFNDYREEPFDGEDRELIQSPKEVSTYDQKPEMSAYQVKDATKKAILSGKYGLIVVNFANADMVGHTGVLGAAVKACETVDECVGELLEAIDQVGGKAVITADHGNSDQMQFEDGSGAHTSHTLNPVEVVVYGQGCDGLKLKQGGRLADIAPTVLKLMDLPQPAAMTGECLIQA
ncbi:MAG: 2,3-bisphosphoglycerate-independent phosphoglycerate mutase [Verrucomicrobiota bacterium JB022]|nr:2,3-bisphosphoglycerate-independent phosphoglycerate mutase [Verrucomicrobiota bacterium JB022]